MDTKKTIKIRQSLGYTGYCRHDHARIIVPDRLPVKLDIKDTRILVNVGEFVVLPPFTPYAFASAAARDLIDFDFSLLSENPEFTLLLPVLSSPYVCRSEKPEATPEAKAFGRIVPVYSQKKDPPRKESEAASPMDLVKSMISFASAGKSFPLTATLSLFNALFCLIGGEITEAIKESEPGFSADTAGRLSAAISFINHHFHENIDLKETAKEAGYNHTHLSHIFKKIYGISLYDYLIHTRLVNAASLISGKNSTSSEAGLLSISEIALVSGFSSSSTFNRCFLNEFGLSPRDFAKLPGDEQHA